MNLPVNRDLHRKKALGLVVALKPYSAGPTCMSVEKIEQLSYTSAIASPYSAPRAEYEKQLAQRYPQRFYGAGMVVMRIQHAADTEGETTYAVPIPIRSAEASIPETDDNWEELLALRLHKGVYLDPKSDVKAHDMLVTMIRRNTQLDLEEPQRWRWTYKDTDGESRTYICTFGRSSYAHTDIISFRTPMRTLDQLIDSEFLSVFKRALRSAERKIAVSQLQRYMDHMRPNLGISEDRSMCRVCDHHA